MAAQKLVGPEWPMDAQFLAYQLRLMFNRRTGRNKSYELLRASKQTKQPAGPEAIMVHIGNARERIVKLNNLESDWCASIQSHFPRSQEPPPVKLPPYTVAHHREHAKLWRIRHLQSWTRGVPMPALLPELPEAVRILSLSSYSLSSTSSQVRRVFRVYKGNAPKDGDDSAGMHSVASVQTSAELSSEVWLDPYCGTCDRSAGSCACGSVSKACPCSCCGCTGYKDTDFFFCPSCCCTSGC